MWIFYFIAVFGFISAVLACFVKNKVGKAILSVVSLLSFFVTSVISAGFILPSYIGVHRTCLLFVVCGAAFLIAMLFAWKPFKTKIRVISASSIAFITLIVTGIFTIPAIYQNSITINSHEEIWLGPYAPFGEYYYNEARELTHRETLAARLNEASTLKLHDNLPVLDGATALYPLYAAFVRAAYPEPEPSLDIPGYSPYGDLREPSNESIVVCSRTAGAFENLIDGYADIVFLMGVSDEQRKFASDRGVELILTPIGREAFVFFVHRRNSANNLSSSDIKRIYSGEVTNWNEVGGKNNAIRAYQRPETSGSQTKLNEIMGDTPITPAPEDDVFDVMMGMVSRVASYRNYRNSLGYSFLYYVRDMLNEHNIKFLSIDGIEPTNEHIASGVYPYADDFYAVTVKRDGGYLNAERTENIDAFIGWILSEQGQYLVKATGYVPKN
jgi:phosphate transport system substrate-binding protein